MENFDQKPIFRCLICNGHFGTLEENEYGLWGHIIDPEEAEQAVSYTHLTLPTKRIV